ncbi:hypothetical protein, partial [Pseudoalteromonas sp. Of7M-16]|uniref:hypothetical protein n=1 Tax=Pseudoalteromonas sp. Of7M-16 TaxID=2917756 RepID=UPI001EF4CF8B
VGGVFLPGGGDLKLSQIVKGTVISAIIGGTVSEITGGKFSNGARTGAMQYVLNQASMSIQQGEANCNKCYPNGAVHKTERPDWLLELEEGLSTIAYNRMTGKWAEQEVFDMLVLDEGQYAVLGGVTLRVGSDFELRYPDITIFNANGSPYAFIEVKSGWAVPTSRQIRLDTIIQSSGGYISRAPTIPHVGSPNRVFGPTQVELFTVPIPGL